MKKKYEEDLVDSYEEYELYEEYEEASEPQDDLVFVDLSVDEDAMEEENTEDEYEEIETEEPKKKHSKLKIAQLVIALVVVVLIVMGFLRVMKWQKGKKLVIDPDSLTEDYTTESMDYVEYFDPTRVDGYCYDGSWDILILGDCSIYGEDEKKGIAGQLKDKTGANVISLSLPDTALSFKNVNYSLDDPTDAFALYGIVYSMAIAEVPNYAMQEEAATYMKDSEIYTAYIEKLKSLDMESIDTILIAYGTYDFLQNRPTLDGFATEETPYGTATGVDGALYNAIKILKARYPEKQIVVSSPNFFFVESEDGMIGADLQKNLGGTLGDYIGGMGAATSATNSCFVDNYFGAGFNCDNYEGFLTEDGTGLTEKGVRAIVDHIYKFLYIPK